MISKTFVPIMIIVMLCSTACGREAIEWPQACVENKPKRAAALKTKDWNALEVAAVRFIEGCDKAYGDEEFAKAHAELSLVLRHRNDPKNAAEFANRAISYSKEPDFHIEKALCLIRLNKKEEASLELDVAELMSKLALKNNELRKIAWAPREAPDYDKKRLNYVRILESVKVTRRQISAAK